MHSKGYKTCRCCELEFLSREAFLKGTSSLGFQELEDESWIRVEYRSCLSCGNTLAHYVEAEVLAEDSALVGT